MNTFDMRFGPGGPEAENRAEGGVGEMVKWRLGEEGGQKDEDRYRGGTTGEGAEKVYSEVDGKRQIPGANYRWFIAGIGAPPPHRGTVARRNGSATPSTTL